MSLSILLTPTVKRDLSLFSVQSWYRGYGYRALFHYDGKVVNFYAIAEEFKRFKEVEMGRMKKDDALFFKTNNEFQANVHLLRSKLDSGLGDLRELSLLIGKIMSFYMMVVSDSFVAAQPAAWKSRYMSEGILYETDAAVEKFLNNPFAHVLTVDEVVSGEWVKDELLKRQGGYIIDLDGQIITEQDFKEYCLAHGFVNPEFIETVHGQPIVGKTAYPGKATGTVRIVRSREDLAQVEKGDIVVAVMTNAHFAPVMGMIAGLITDEGGVTCHAAIAAREFKLPCITGTGNSTHVLKDGDSVEMDTDSGQVRILA